MTTPEDKRSRRESFNRTNPADMRTPSMIPLCPAGYRSTNKNEVQTPAQSARNNQNDLNVSNPNYMVSEPGGPGNAELLEWMDYVPRFPTELIGPAEADRQSQDRERWIQRMNWPKFDDTSEGAVDKWFDVVAEDVKQYNIGPELFVYLLSSKVPRAVGSVLRKSQYVMHEVKVTEVILSLFPVSTYARKLEEILFQTKRMNTVREAVMRTQNCAYAYLRACARRSRPLCMTHYSLQDFALCSLPAIVHKKFASAHGIDSEWPSLDAVFQAARRIELTMYEHSGIIPQEVAFPASNWHTNDVVTPNQPSYSGQSPALRDKPKPNNPCTCCGELHWIKDCPYKTHRCEMCRLLGHIEKMCKSHVIKSEDGRIECVLTQHAGSTELHLYKDRTQASKLQTASSAIKKIIDAINIRSERGKEKRQQQKANQKRESGVVQGSWGRAYIAQPNMTGDQRTSSASPAPQDEVHFLGAVD